MKSILKKVTVFILAILISNISLYGMYMIDYKNLGEDATSVPFIAVGILVDFVLIILILFERGDIENKNNNKSHGYYNPRGHPSDDHANF